MSCWRNPRKVSTWPSMKHYWCVTPLVISVKRIGCWWLTYWLLRLRPYSTSFWRLTHRCPVPNSLLMPPVSWKVRPRFDTNISLPVVSARPKGRRHPSFSPPSSLTAENRIFAHKRTGGVVPVADKRWFGDGAVALLATWGSSRLMTTALCFSTPDQPIESRAVPTTPGRRPSPSAKTTSRYSHKPHGNSNWRTIPKA